VLFNPIPQTGFELHQKVPGKTACFQNCPPAGPPVSIHQRTGCIRVGSDLVGPRCPSANRVAAGGAIDARSSGCIRCVRDCPYSMGQDNRAPPGPPRVASIIPPRCILVGSDSVGPRCPSASRVAAGGSGDARSSGCIGCVRDWPYSMGLGSRTTTRTTGGNPPLFS